MSDVGNLGSGNDYLDSIPTHFSQNIKKIENGKMIVNGQGELAEQLKGARKYAANWSIEVLDVLTDDKKNSAVVRFTWNSEKVGLHITTAILKFDKDNKIEGILEVYNAHGDITH